MQLSMARALRRQKTEAAAALKIYHIDKMDIIVYNTHIFFNHIRSKENASYS